MAAFGAVRRMGEGRWERPGREGLALWPPVAKRQALAAATQPSALRVHDMSSACAINARSVKGIEAILRI